MAIQIYIQIKTIIQCKEKILNRKKETADDEIEKFLCKKQTYKTPVDENLYKNTTQRVIFLQKKFT